MILQKFFEIQVFPALRLTAIFEEAIFGKLRWIFVFMVALAVSKEFLPVAPHRVAAEAAKLGGPGLHFEGEVTFERNEHGIDHKFTRLIKLTRLI